MSDAPTVRWMLSLALLVAGGCVETRFESPLGDHAAPCDARWKGLWIPSDETPPRTGGANTAFDVDDGCGLTLLDRPAPGGALTRVHVPLAYVHAGGNDYLVVTEHAARELVALPPPHGVQPAPETAYFFIRYDVRGDRIRLYQVDTARVARLVIDGMLDGTVDKHANELHVFVQGDRTRMLERVRTLSVFEDRPSLQLVRSTRTVAEFEHLPLQGHGGTR